MKRDNTYLINNTFANGSGSNTTSFTKGMIPWNKGKKGIRLSRQTEFKKGQRSANWLPVGTITIRIDKSGKRRRWIKRYPKTWIEYARFIWIQNNQNISVGFLIHHIDHDTLNDKIDNLAMVTRKEHMEIHAIGELGRKAKAIKYRLSQEELF